MNILFLLLSLLTFIAMGANANLFVAWNILPIVFVAIVYNKTDFKGALKSSVFHMILGTTLLHIVFHTVMYFDIGKAATGSSTAALGYIFFPIHAMLFGGLVYLLSKAITFICVKPIQRE
ncbi:hypothetical protein [Pseudoalteromonas sp. H105]|jgi:hypothetical protein|uniref:hypothetical protein n=1 Tax=Pseudoalteromonas sp. H105 TaxID=1348393 RepID=UPI00073238C1|nr:hypothetical protein [Pseudoalteromonas sp. H105]KTF13096.1 hypothetical protein ATS75_16945 [Pseudoalteromonas sp. H105]